MSANLDIDLLRAFTTVAECRHFTLAAERLQRTQSAVSMQVKRLESRVGARLFERSTRGVRLTADGEAFRRYAQGLLRLNDEALAAFGRPSVQGRVRLGATDTTMCLLPPILSRFAEAYPLVELEIRCERSWEALTALEAGELDLALVTQSCGHTGGELLCREPLVWATARDSAVDELEPLPLALFGPGCVYREAALKALDTAGRSWRHAYNSASRDGLDVAVSAGLAVTATPLSALPSEWRVLGSDRGFPPLPEMDVLLYHATGEASAPVATLADVIAESLREGPAQHLHRPASATTGE